MSIRYSTYVNYPRQTHAYFGIILDELKTIEDFEEAHRLYWSFIARDGLRYKPAIVSLDTEKPVYIHARCFACEYSYRISDNKKFMDCQFCPIKKYRDEYSPCPCMNLGEPYRKFDTTGGSLYAKMISELKFTDPREDQHL